MQNENNPDKAKAEAFFQRAASVAVSNNFDYAIDLYMEGLRCEPDALFQGHHKLFELALHRKTIGGKKPSIMEKAKHIGGKTPLQAMLNAEYLFAKDPDHLPYAEAMLKAAVNGGYTKTAKWIADLIFQTNNSSAKPSLHTYLVLKDSYENLNLLDRAVSACQRVCKLKPNDKDLADELKRLTTELTVSSGKYDQAGDFRNSVKNLQAQEKLQAQQSVVKTVDYRQQNVEDAQKEYQADPNLPKNIFNLSDALFDMQTDESENQAIDLLENVYKTKNDFSFKQRAGILRIKQITRRLRQAKQFLEDNPEDNLASAEVDELKKLLSKTELEHYRLCVENYPTDLPSKYEYAIRLMNNNLFNDAIPLFQDAQREPRYRFPAMNKIGLCFFMMEWYPDAIDIFSQAIEAYEIQDDGLAKELRYNMGRAYEKTGEMEKSLELYRKIAQLDFGYKDIRQRIDKLRK